METQTGQETHKPNIYQLSCEKNGFVELSQVVGPKWASPEFYIGSVREEYGSLFRAITPALDVCKDVIDLFCLNENEDIKRLCKKAKIAIGIAYKT